MTTARPAGLSVRAGCGGVLWTYVRRRADLRRAGLWAGVPEPEVRVRGPDFSRVVDGDALSDPAEA